MTYSGTDLVCRGTFTLNSIDVSAEVTGVILKGMTNDVQIPATLTNGIAHAAGATKYQIQIDYLSDDSSTTATLFGILWTAIGTATKELTYAVRLRPGAKGSTNPSWSGTLVVSGADLGGKVEDLSTGSITCILTGAPAIDEA